MTYDDNDGNNTYCRWCMYNHERQKVNYISDWGLDHQPLSFWRYAMPETCETCKYYAESWDGEHCKFCSNDTSKYESQDIPASK